MKLLYEIESRFIFPFFSTIFHIGKLLKNLKNYMPRVEFPLESIS